MFYDSSLWTKIHALKLTAPVAELADLGELGEGLCWVFVALSFLPM